MADGRPQKVTMDWFIGSTSVTDLEEYKSKLQGMAADPVLMKLKALIKRQADMSEARMTSLKTFDKPGWAGMQAHQMGAHSMANYILELLEFVLEE